MFPGGKSNSSLPCLEFRFGGRTIHSIEQGSNETHGLETLPARPGPSLNLHEFTSDNALGSQFFWLIGEM